MVSAEEVVQEGVPIEEQQAPLNDTGNDDSQDLVVTEQDELALDDEASALLAELGESQAQVKRMLDMQQEQASEIVHLRDELARELSQLQDEAWRLQAVNELEVLKRQLEQLNNLEAGLDAAEAYLDVDEQQEAAAGAGPRARVLGSAVDAAGQLDASDDADDAAGAGCDDDDVGDLDLEGITQLQAQLDEDLASLMTRLNAVRNEASAVSARKDQLVSDLRNLLALQAEADDTTLDDHDQKLAAYEAALTSSDALPAASPTAAQPVS